MKNLDCLNEYRVSLCGEIGDSYNGAFMLQLPISRLAFTVMASNGGGWEHVSVSTAERIPKWNEMQMIKEMFFESHEVVMQIHPAANNYVNCHPHCLHLWRPLESDIPLPPLYMI